MHPSYSAGMSACEKGGLWQRALELLEGMPQRALTPNVISYNAAILVHAILHEPFSLKPYWLKELWLKLKQCGKESGTQ